MLKKLGYEADVVSNGREAVQALQSKHYDVILMDVQMPEMDGLEATRAISEMILEKEAQDRAMTAYALEGDRERCFESRHGRIYLQAGADRGAEGGPGATGRGQQREIRLRR